MSREKAENMAESVVNEWNADYIEEDSTIDPDKDETLDNKKFYAHLERLIADAIEKAVAEQQAEIDRLKSELERVNGFREELARKHREKCDLYREVEARAIEYKAELHTARQQLKECWEVIDGAAKVFRSYERQKGKSI